MLKEYGLTYELNDQCLMTNIQIVYNTFVLSSTLKLQLGLRILIHTILLSIFN